MDGAWKSFSERVGRLNPLMMLGRGMDLGEVTSLAPQILFRVIMEVFFRELNEDERRDRASIHIIVKETCERMQIKVEESVVQRLSSGLLYRGDEKMSEPFRSPLFNEIDNQWTEQIYRYLEMDPLHTHLESGGNIVYQLTDVSQEIIFMSREISEEFSISIEQLYSMQLIRNGNFQKASDNLNHLIAKVRKLSDEEKRSIQQIQQDPKILVLGGVKQRQFHQEEIESQFEDEKKYFRQIFSLIHKVSGEQEDPAIKHELSILLERVEHSRKLHDRFANLVFQHISLEMELKTKNPALFWDKSVVSFKENIYEGWVMKEGIHDFGVAEEIVNGLFSPITEFMLPLEWVWGEQKNIYIIEETEEGEEEFEEEFERTSVDWKSVAKAWNPVFEQLKEIGEFSLHQLKELPREEQDNWFEERITYDLWMLFDRKAFSIEPLEGGVWNDEREKLFQELLKLDESYQKLIGKKIVAEYSDEEPDFAWYGTRMTPYKLILKGRDEV
ncbi:hypothetical protein CEY16_07845 [Halalkalibacillus sediminis]|uniref:Uncharacterized protein n=1 Tax=Halalkalibacillus sediminis TaxID=2018042 RepID=A0A2I0QU07_9BACI|nr:hypothetical protein [Halalkalibacillus sediminis]PKR77832.1 hypothetical protein CEY16_07845 [Halalkalibacillus sediminis]